MDESTWLRPKADTFIFTPRIVPYSFKLLTSRWIRATSRNGPRTFVIALRFYEQVAGQEEIVRVSVSTRFDVDPNSY